MSILFIILIIIGALVVLLLIAAAASGNEYAIASSIVIGRPAADVYTFVKYLDNQGQYNKWVMADPNVRKTFKGTDGTVGFFYGWESDNKQVGKGEQTITVLDENKRVEYHLRFIQPFQAEATSYITTEAITNGQTRVTWGFGGQRNFMMKLMHIVFNLQKALTKDLYTNLQNLKGILEK